MLKSYVVIAQIKTNHVLKVVEILFCDVHYLLAREIAEDYFVGQFLLASIQDEKAIQQVHNVQDLLS